ncbi:MAG: flagellar motor protein MotB [Bradymonadia bacterium]
MDDELLDIEEEESAEMPADEKCPEGTPEWLVTFGDMMSLLLTFFILLLSFAQMEKVKYQMVSGAMMQAFGVQEKVKAFNRPQGHNVVATEFWSTTSKSMMNGMRTAAKKHARRSAPGTVDVAVFEDYRGIVLQIGEEAMFEKGRSQLRPAVWPFLDEVLEIALKNASFIRVEAHTDSSPIRTAEFPSNDHLSGSRAVSVVRYFQGRAQTLAAGLPGDARLDPHRMEAVAMGATHPKVPNTFRAGRRRNRRVEIVFEELPQDYRR